MKISMKSLTALGFFAVACLVGVATILIVQSIVTNQIIFEAQERVKDHLSSARWVYNARIRDIDQVIRLTSIRHVLKIGIKKRNLSAIRDELSALMAQEDLDFMSLIDEKGTVLFRFHNPPSSGDSQIRDPFVKKGLERRSVSGTQVLSREELMREGEVFAQRASLVLVPTPKERPTAKTEETSGMVLKSVHPILDFNGDLLGLLMGGILLNRQHEIVDRIKNIVFKDAKYKGKEIGTATIFLGDLRISTNVRNKEGRRALGTRAMKEVYEQVFEKGIPWVRRAFVVDDWYITAYEPIRDIDGKIVGMLYVGMLESKYAVMKERIIFFFFLLSMSGMLTAFAISFILSWKILKRGAT